LTAKKGGEELQDESRESNCVLIVRGWGGKAAKDDSREMDGVRQSKKGRVGLHRDVGEGSPRTVQGETDGFQYQV
jgi:hypothetical protein